MIRIRMADMGKDGREMLDLGIALANYIADNTSRNSIVLGKGIVGHGPNHRSIKIRYSMDKEGPENVHEITIRDPYNEAKLAGELRSTYKQHHFSEMQ